MDKAVYQQMHDVEEQHWWFAGRRQIIKHLLSGLNLAPEARILDAGCGTGGNLSLLAEFGEVVGVEFDEAAAEMARARRVGQVLRGGLPDELPLTNQTFDLIVLLDVLEHLERDLESLQRLGSMLKAGGYLVITVPAFPFLWSHHDDIHHHKRRYTVATLKRSIREAGLHTKFITYYNTWLFPAAAAVRLAQKILPTNPPQTAVELPPRYANRILKMILSSERFFIPWIRLPVGLSLLAVIQE